MMAMKEDGPNDVVDILSIERHEKGDYVDSSTYDVFNLKENIRFRNLASDQHHVYSSRSGISKTLTSDIFFYNVK